MRCYVLTGAPGAGKTTLAEALRRRGWPVVAEAATDVIAAEQARGVGEPWREAGFLDAVARVQRERREAPGTYGRVRIHDRSPLCTLALARHLGRPPGRVLVEEVRRVLRDGAYERPVFLVQPLGFVPRAPVRVRVALVETHLRHLAVLPPDRAEGVPDPAYLT